MTAPASLTAAYRLPLPSSLVWIEADRAAILDEKADLLASAKPADEAPVASLADGLRARPSMRRWVLESVAPEVLERNMRAWSTILSQANAEWKFAHPDGFDFFRARGWSTIVKRPFMVQARRLGRGSEMPRAWLLRALSSLSERFRRRMENLVVYGVMLPDPR